MKLGANRIGTRVMNTGIDGYEHNQSEMIQLTEFVPKLWAIKAAEMFLQTPKDLVFPNQACGDRFMEIVPRDKIQGHTFAYIENGNKLLYSLEKNPIIMRK